MRVNRFYQKEGLVVLIMLLFVFCPSCQSSDDDDSEQTQDMSGEAGLVINEIAAKDAFGGSDWFELYVTSSEPITLSEYSIVDDSEEHARCSLPDLTLESGSYIVFQAVDEDPGDGSLYVPFKLGADDSLTLYRQEALADSLDWEDGDSPEGFSFGRLPDGNGDPQTLLPTPGAANISAQNSAIRINEIMAQHTDETDDWFELLNSGSETIQLQNFALRDDDRDDTIAFPAISLNAGEYVVFSCNADSDGTDSMVFPFGLGSSDSLTLYSSGIPVDYLQWSDGDAPAGYSFGRYPDGSGLDQTLEPTPGEANRPVTMFDRTSIGDVRITIASEDWQAILANPLAEEYHPCSITFNGILVEDVAIRTKGNSSLKNVANNPNSIRYSFKVDMNYYHDGQSLCGLKKLNLNNGFKDPSFMRENISYDLLDEMGVPVPEHCFVRLYINDVLFGLYTAVEQIDSFFIEKNFLITDGDLYKPDGVGSDLLWHGDSIDDYPGVELKTNEESSDHASFLNFLQVLNYGSSLYSVFDIDTFLRYLAVSTAMSNLDSYQGPLAHNFYLYEENGYFTLLPWDFNESFGSFSMGCSRAELIHFMIDEPTSSLIAERPLIHKILASSQYRDLYHRYLQEFIDGPFSPDSMEARIFSMASLIDDAVAADPTRFFTYAEFTRSLTQDIGNIFGLFPFIEARVNSVQKQLDGTEVSSGDGSGNCQQQPPPPPTGE